MIFAKNKPTNKLKASCMSSLPSLSVELSSYTHTRPYICYFCLGDNKNEMCPFSDWSHLICPCFQWCSLCLSSGIFTPLVIPHPFSQIVCVADILARTWSWNWTILLHLCFAWSLRRGPLGIPGDKVQDLEGAISFDSHRTAQRPASHLAWQGSPFCMINCVTWAWEMGHLPSPSLQSCQGEGKQENVTGLERSVEMLKSCPTHMLPSASLSNSKVCHFLRLSSAFRKWIAPCQII